MVHCVQVPIEGITIDGPLCDSRCSAVCMKYLGTCPGRNMSASALELCNRVVCGAMRRNLTLEVEAILIDLVTSS